jgi:hypothetical protein
MDENGYPLEIGKENIFLETFVLSTAKRKHLGDKMIVLYDGKGKIDYWGGWTPIERKTGRDVVKLEENGPLVLRIHETDKDDHLRNIRIVEEKYENSFERNPFRDEFLNRWADMKAIRFMDWMKTNNSSISRWEDRPKPKDRTYSEKGVPLEIMIDLCNRLKILPWFCMPHTADDDYIRNSAEIVKKKLNPELKVYVEYSNEVWNGIFSQSQYARVAGTNLKLSENPFQAQLFYYSKRSAEIFRIWEGILGREKIIKVLASQSANPWVSQQILEFNENYKICDALAIAPYFGHSYGNPQTQSKVENMTKDEIFSELPKEIEKIMDTVKKHSELCRKYNLKLIAYEGGQHFVGFGGAENNQKLMELFFSLNRDKRMEDIYRMYLEKWKQTGGGLFVLFSSMCAPSKWGSWGLLEYEGQNIEESPKFKAIKTKGVNS